jgi:transposase
MTKLKLKTSGTFRSLKGANAFARIRGYISTLRKQGLDILDSLVNLFRDNPLWL